MKEKQAVLQMFVIYRDCTVPEQIHTYTMEGHWKISKGRGVLQAKILEAKYEAKLGGGGGAKQKNLPWGEYGYYLELHIFS